jgi:hypothetical protein
MQIAGVAEEREPWEATASILRLPSYIHLHHSVFTYVPSILLVYLAISILNLIRIIPRDPDSSSNVNISTVGYTVGRRTFTTRDGYIGLGPGAVRHGDHIALLQGGKLPVVLGEKGSDYELVGDSYIHGIMSGERYDSSSCDDIWLI